MSGLINLKTMCRKKLYSYIEVIKWSDNQVTFFYELNDGEKIKLIDQYNKDCIDTYNKMINE